MPKATPMCITKRPAPQKQTGDSTFYAGRPGASGGAILPKELPRNVVRFQPSQRRLALEAALLRIARELHQLNMEELCEDKLRPAGAGARALGSEDAEA